MRRALYMTALVFGIGLAFLSESGIANAEPVLKARTQGSDFIVETTNSEDVGYNCNISYTLHFIDFGTPGSEKFEKTTYVLPKASGAVLVHPTGKAASTLSHSAFNSSCFRASQPSAKQTPPPITKTPPPPQYRRPFGTYRKTCKSCRMQGSILVCQCDGKNTSLDILSCGSGADQICNNNGKLSCPGKC